MVKALFDLGKQSRPRIVLIGMLLMAVLAAVDYLTGSELEISLLYLLPVSIVAWYVSRQGGYGMSILAAAVWVAVNLHNRTGTAQTGALVWNAALLLGFCMTLTVTLSALHDARRRQTELTRLIVHDLRSPLSISVMSLDVLDENFGDQIEPAQRELLAVCRMSYNQMMTLINSILDLARLESGQMPLQRVRIEVRPLVEATIQAMGIEAQQKNLKLVTDLDPKVPAVFADQTVTERILLNVLGNAIKFSPPDGTITIRVGPGQDTMAQISVRDEGRGIPPAWQSRIFDRFQQVEGQGDGSKAGSGLGLAFCRLAVEAQGGHIWVDSVMGHGATIHFTLPIEE